MRKALSTNNLYEPHGEIRTRLWLLLPLRLYVGYYFIRASIGKVVVDKLGHSLLNTPDLLLTLPAGSGGRGMKAIIENPDYPYGFYRAFFHALIEPHPGLFVFLVVFGELLAGLAILCGGLTRPACLAGLFMVANFFLAYNVELSKPHNTTSFAVMLLVLFFTGAGRTYGADHYLKGRAPDWLA